MKGENKQQKFNENKMLIFLFFDNHVSVLQYQSVHIIRIENDIFITIIATQMKTNAIFSTSKKHLILILGPN